MPSQISHILPALTVFFKTCFYWLDKISQIAHQHFGLVGQIAFFALVFYLFYLIISGIIKSVLDLALRIVLPSILLSGATVCLFSYSFFQVLPVFLCVMLVVNFIKH